MYTKVLCQLDKWAKKIIIIRSIAPRAGTRGGGGGGGGPKLGLWNRLDKVAKDMVGATQSPHQWDLFPLRPTHAR
jgi:hypothetical protein